MKKNLRKIILSLVTAGIFATNVFAMQEVPTTIKQEEIKQESKLTKLWNSLKSIPIYNDNPYEDLGGDAPEEEVANSAENSPFNLLGLNDDLLYLVLDSETLKLNIKDLLNLRFVNQKFNKFSNNIIFNNLDKFETSIVNYK